MSNLTAVIFGATGGIGHAIAHHFAEKGLNLILVGRKQDTLQQLEQSLAQQYPQLQLHSLRCDLIDASSRHDFIQALAALKHPIHYYINNAGMNDFRLFAQQSQDTIEQMMLVNVAYPLQLIQDVIPYMSDSQPSQIINIGSTFGSIGYPGYVSYCASKFALRGATEALAREYCQTAIRFRYFSPRATNTSMNNPDVIEMNIKMGTKVDSPEFVAQELYQFLQTDRQSYQVGYPEKVFVKLNQLMPSRVAAAIQKDLDTIYEYADQSKASFIQQTSAS
ncbi:SDR family oxidoreductase [Acinetobacter sp. YH12095]|uniref:SDR family oxidoreductase n=1 Tax=Acinetobacter sp. YH12095 TaxID=2601084 RepID=UPI0015D3C8B3|nr:SDR family oxidoreductase [Acinetobacter sp. YH12095]